LKPRAVSLLLLVALVSIVMAQSVVARIEGNQLHIAAPRVHFLIGEALQKLHDGATVSYELQLTARADGSVKALARSVEHFSVSYDLWEEKFAIAKVSGTAKTISHLSASAAEAWCVDNTSLPAGVLPPSEAFWVRLDYRADEPAAPTEAANSSFTLGGLVDIFSRRVRREQIQGSEEVGPLRLRDLRGK
jgi:hypothetical protein